MRPRSFTTRSAECHRRWLGDLLDLEIKENTGIDLYDDSLGVELKTRYEKYPHTFAIDFDQFATYPRAYKRRNLFWAFLTYNLTREPRSIRKNVEPYVTDRNIWFFPWEWVWQFPVHSPRTGHYIYVKARDFPEDGYEQFENDDAVFYMPRNSEIAGRLGLILDTV